MVLRDPARQRVRGPGRLRRLARGGRHEGPAAGRARAPERSEELLEPLGPIPPASLQAAIDDSAGEPVGTYTFAILEVAPGQMDRFASMLAAVGGRWPIVACWRDVAGQPDRVIDLWKGDTGRPGYQPSDERQDAFFEPRRQVVPRERMQRLHPLPYSPLR